jgi:hypothetical protein
MVSPLITTVAAQKMRQKGRSAAVDGSFVLRSSAVSRSTSERRSGYIIADTKSLDGYDAVILGSAVYMGRWLKEARELALLGQR